jgi:rRNA maturation endonuclease Nob1
MIKLRVEYHHICSGCGTELVVDYFDDSSNRRVCPWCGVDCKPIHSAGDAELKNYIHKAVQDIETRANNGLAV